MGVPNTNQLTYNAYIQQMGVLAVVDTIQGLDGVWEGVDPAFNTLIPNMLNYAELRIQRDLNMLPAETTNTYTATAGQSIVSIPIDDFFTIFTVGIINEVNGQSAINQQTLTPVSREFIQNCYSGLSNAGTPKYFAMIGDTFGDGSATYNNILLGPVPNYAYTLLVSGLIRVSSLYAFAVGPAGTGPCDTGYTYISAYYADILCIASMIYITMFQRNFGAVSGDPQMGATYEAQYQALIKNATSDESNKRFQGSGWSSYPVPPGATSTR